MADDGWASDSALLAGVRPALGVLGTVAFVANAGVAAAAAALGWRRGASSELHVLFMTSAAAALSACIVANVAFDDAARRFVGGADACNASGVVLLFLGLSYMSSLSFLAIRTHALIVRNRRLTARDVGLFHAAAWAVAAVLSLALGAWPGHSDLVASRLYCFPQVRTRLGTVAILAVVIVCYAPLIVCYVHAWAVVRSVARAAPARASDRDRDGGSGATRRRPEPPEWRIVRRAVVLTGVFVLAYAPFGAMAAFTQFTGGLAPPSGLDVAAPFALAASFVVSAVLHVRWHAAYRRVAAAWAARAAGYCRQGCVRCRTRRVGPAAAPPATAAAGSAVPAEVMPTRRRTRTSPTGSAVVAAQTGGDGYLEPLFPDHSRGVLAPTPVAAWPIKPPSPSAGDSHGGGDATRPLHGAPAPADGAYAAAVITALSPQDDFVADASSATAVYDAHRDSSGPTTTSGVPTTARVCGADTAPAPAPA